MSDFSTAVASAKNGQITRSKEEFTRILSVDPTNYASLSNMGVLMLQTCSHSQALTNLNKAVEIDPFCHIAYFNRCLCYMAMQEMGKAETDVRRALSCLYLQMGSTTNNLKYLSKSIFQCEGNVRAYLKRAKIFQARRNKIAAQNQYLYAIQYGQELEEVYKSRAEYYLNNNDVEAFERDLSKYLQLRNSQKKPFELKIIKKQIKGEELDKKIKEFKELIESDMKIIEDTIEKVQVPPLIIENKRIAETDEQLLLSSDRHRSQRQGMLLSSERKDIEQQQKNEKEQKIFLQTKKQGKDQFFQKAIQQQYQQTIVGQKNQFMQQLNPYYNKLKNQAELSINDISLRIEQKAKQSTRPQVFPTFQKNFQDIFSQTTPVISLQYPQFSHQQASNFTSLQLPFPIVNDKSVNSSMLGSDDKFITLEQFFLFQKSTIQLINLSMLNDNDLKKYNVTLNFNYSTQQQKTIMPAERPKITFFNVKSYTQVKVRAEVSTAGLFWGKVNQNCTGKINLLQKHARKCLFENDKGEKVFLLYYKLSYK